MLTGRNLDLLPGTKSHVQDNNFGRHRHNTLLRRSPQCSPCFDTPPPEIGDGRRGGDRERAGDRELARAARILLLLEKSCFLLCNFNVEGEVLARCDAPQLDSKHSLGGAYALHHGTMREHVGHGYKGSRCG